jgi:transforming growth factor-beta-induced protein
MRSRHPLLAVAAVGALVLAACGDDGDSATTTAAPVTEAPAPETTEAEGPGTIVEIASGNPDFSTLVDLVVAADLAGTLSGDGPFTVFAPTNEAFAAVPAELLEALGGDTEALAKVLLYHVVVGAAVTSDMVAPGPVEMGDGSSATLSADGGSLFIDGAEIVATDIIASNGVIHVIDAVIVPADLDVEALLGSGDEGAQDDMTDEMAGDEMAGDIVDVAVEAGAFTTLVTAVTTAELVETLASEGPFTVFAPTDEAFEALPEGLVEALLLPENRDVLVQILLYHVVVGAAVTSDMVAPGEVEMASEDVATLSADENGNLFIDDAQIVAVDVMASNGVIHVINAVLVPAGLDVAALLG